jgi:hypothetical protein
MDKHAMAKATVSMKITRRTLSSNGSLIDRPATLPARSPQQASNDRESCLLMDGVKVPPPASADFARYTRRS